MRTYFIILLLQIITLTAYAQEAKESKFVQRPDLPGKLMLDYGYNFVQNNPSEFGTKPIQSKSVGLHYVREFFPVNNVSVSIGAGFGFEKLAFLNDKILTYETIGDNRELRFVNSVFNTKKSKIAMTYVQIPVDIRFYPGGEGQGSRFFVGAGGYIGYLIDAHNKINYNSKNVKTEKQKGDFGLNKLRYGVTAKLGFDSIHLIAKYDLSELFDSNTRPLSKGNANVWSVGIAIDTF